MTTEAAAPATRRMTVDDTEASLVERARAIQKLRAKRDRVRQELAELDLEIAGQERELRTALLPAGTDAE